MGVLHVTAELDYAVRALAMLAAAPDRPTTTATIAADGMSATFLQQVLGRLRCAGLLRARRGAGGGYWLARPPDAISVGDVVRALQPSHPDRAMRTGDVEALWAELDGQVQARLDETTLAAFLGRRP